jgi:L-seryl-tRNA(Ser) seleniumtransferase
MKRRDLPKSIDRSACRTIAGAWLPFESTNAASKSKKRNLFEELGVRTFINAAGTYAF